MKWGEYQNTHACQSQWKGKQAKSRSPLQRAWRQRGTRSSAGTRSRPSGARCQKAVTNCQPRLKMISESGVRSSVLCFSPSLSGEQRGSPVTSTSPEVIYSPLHKLHKSTALHSGLLLFFLFIRPLLVTSVTPVLQRRCQAYAVRHANYSQRARFVSACAKTNYNKYIKIN